MADYGLDRGRTLRRAVGNATAEITLADHGSVQMRWVTAKGARQKTAPASVRRDDPESVATLVTLARDIARMVVVQRERVEGLLREEERRWDFAAWRARYMEHPVVSVIAQRLIWRLRWGSRTSTAIELDGDLVDVDGRAGTRRAGRADLAVASATGSQRGVLAWRRFLETHGVRQPFKQAHREVLRAGAEDGALAYHPKRMMWARPDPGTV